MTRQVHIEFHYNIDEHVVIGSDKSGMSDGQALDAIVHAVRLHVNPVLRELGMIPAESPEIRITNY